MGDLSATAIPELVTPPQFENGMTAEAPAEGTPEPAAEVFTSQREVLGKPIEVVPADPVPPPAVESRPTASSPGWYKLATGALFILSLGYVGYRNKRRPVPEDLTDYAASWMPPRRGFAREPVDDFSEINNDFLVRKAQGRRRARPVSDDESEPGFHDEVERRVKRLAANKNSDLMDPRSRVLNRDASARSAEYAQIAEWAAQGVPRREIARRLSVPVGEVNAVIGVRNRVIPPGGSGAVPMEIR